MHVCEGRSFHRSREKIFIQLWLWLLDFLKLHGKCSITTTSNAFIFYLEAAGIQALKREKGVLGGFGLCFMLPVFPVAMDSAFKSV